MEPLIIALSNVIFRGSMKGGRYIHALIFGLCFWSWGWAVILAATAGMFLGSMPALFKPATDQAYNDRKFGRWARVVAARGFVWCLAVSLALVYWLGNAVWLFMSCAPFMPVAYSPVWWFKDYGKVINRWRLSEFFWGLVMGLPFILLRLSELH